MSLQRVQDPKLSQRMLVDQFRRNFATQNAEGEITNVRIQAAQNSLNGSRVGQITIKSDTFNPSVEATYNNDVYYENGTEDDLQTGHFRILQKIGVPPEKYVQGNAYNVGDLVYLNTIEDESLYCCTTNISQGNFYNPLTQPDHWQITPNYYSENSYLEILQKWIEQILDRPIEIYDENTRYYKNNWCYCGRYYEVDESGTLQAYQGDVVALCITNNEDGIINEPPTPLSTEWVQFGLRGKTGAPSMGVKNAGKWQAGTSYEPLDLVFYENDHEVGLYVCISAVSGSTEPPNDSTHWLETWHTAYNSIPILTSGMGEHIYCIRSGDQITFYLNDNGSPEIMYMTTNCSQVNINTSNYVWNPANDDILGVVGSLWDYSMVDSIRQEG